MGMESCPLTAGGLVGWMKQMGSYPLTANNSVCVVWLIQYNLWGIQRYIVASSPPIEDSHWAVVSLWVFFHRVRVRL